MQKLYKNGSIYYLLQKKVNQNNNMKYVLKIVKYNDGKSSNMLFEYDIVLFLLIYSHNNFAVTKRVTQRHLYHEP